MFLHFTIAVFATIQTSRMTGRHFPSELAQHVLLNLSDRIPGSSLTQKSLFGRL